MKCPYEIPFSTPELSNVAGEFWIYDANHRPLFYVDKKEQADYIVQAINSYKKLAEAICEAECPVCGGIVEFTELGFTVCPHCKGTRAELTITEWEIIKDKEDD